jgi:hypothetical protein
MNPVELSMLNPVSVYNYSYDDAVLLYSLVTLLFRMSGNTMHLSSILAAVLLVISSDA